ncbi:MAG: hypothetical protein K9M11_01440 [Candidatus Pacebacteria bacterium]|nr:hypothetical protein [Candidatus Paceibacterota bacterium]
MKTKLNPLRKTVRRFVSVGEQRWLRKIRKDEQDHMDELDPSTRVKRPKKPEESSFVKFMNQLKMRGPKTPNLYDQWTKEIHERMREKGTWPTGMTDWDLNILAQYLQELMKKFWRSVPQQIRERTLFKWCDSYAHDMWERWTEVFDCPGVKLFKDYDAQQQAKISFVRSLRTYKKIHHRIREHGRRKKLFIMATWSQRRSLTRNYIDHYPASGHGRFRVWSEHDWAIMYESYVKVSPILIMPHVIKKLDRIDDNHWTEQRIPKSMTEEELMTALL